MTTLCVLYKLDDVMEVVFSDQTFINATIILSLKKDKFFLKRSSSVLENKQTLTIGVFF